MKGKTKAPVTRHHKRVDYSMFEEIATLLGKTAPELAEACGYHRSAPSGWREDGVPMAAFLAAKYWQVASAPTGDKPEQRSLLLVEFVNGALHKTYHVNDPDEMTVSGKKYWLIPAETLRHNLS